ncbi:MAG: YbjQ family protein [Flavobacteriales bacterium]|nr:YbjQ family protein [Flavobacteriales bacterium]|tara:strand:- start:1532 stop:1846 length:315 start_codon:yes stop_codon:yes gene_type:complete
MIISTTENIPNKEVVEILGIARGSTVRARNVGRDIFAAVKNLVGGEITEYTKLQADSREQALQRMKEDALKLNADAIINVRITTSMIMQGVAEILAYGTAVKLK